MATITKIPFSGSTDFRGIKVAATSIGSGTTVHTAQASGSLPDVVTLFVFNSDTVTRVLTLGWGGTTSPDDLITIACPISGGLMLVAPDLPIRNSLVIKASADSANKLILFGYVNRVS